MWAIVQPPPNAHAPIAHYWRPVMLAKFEPLCGHLRQRVRSALKPAADEVKCHVCRRLTSRMALEGNA